MRWLKFISIKLRLCKTLSISVWLSIFLLRLCLCCSVFFSPRSLTDCGSPPQLPTPGPGQCYSKQTISQTQTTTTPAYLSVPTKMIIITPLFFKVLPRYTARPGRRAVDDGDDQLYKWFASQQCAPPSFFESVDLQFRNGLHFLPTTTDRPTLHGLYLLYTLRLQQLLLLSPYPGDIRALIHPSVRSTSQSQKTQHQQKQQHQQRQQTIYAANHHPSTHPPTNHPHLHCPGNIFANLLGKCFTAF